MYEISVTPIRQILPQFESLSRSYSGRNGSNQYSGIELLTDFARDNTIGIGTFTYCDGDLNYLPLGENRDFLGYRDGYRLFLWMPTNTVSMDGWAVELYDQDMNLVCTTADRFEYPGTDCGQIYLETGWLPVTEKATGQEGFFNLYTQEWRPLASSESLRGGGSFMSSFTGYSCYSEGLAYVTSADFCRTYYSTTDLEIREREVLGFSGTRRASTPSALRTCPSLRGWW